MTKQTIHDRIMGRHHDLPEGQDAKRGRMGRGRGPSLLTAGLIVVIVIAAVAGFAVRHYPKLASLTGMEVMTLSGSSEAAAATIGEPSTPFLQHVREAGIETCGTIFPALGRTMTDSAEYAIQTGWDKTAPNDHSLQAVAGLKYDTPTYKGLAVGVVFASPVAKGCEGNMVRVAPFPKTCQDVVGLLPPGSLQAGMLAGTPLFNLANNAGQAMLMPVGNACVVISVARLAE